jgi:hypothetical protein
LEARARFSIPRVVRRACEELGLDRSQPLVDDFGIDAVIRKKDNQFVEVQIKARSRTVKEGDAGLFAAIVHPLPRNNYYFVFYSERLDAMWIMSSEQFIAEAVQNKSGKNVGKRSIWFNGTKTDAATKKKVEYPKLRYEKYRAQNFSIFRRVTELASAGGERRRPRSRGTVAAPLCWHFSDPRRYPN